MYLVIGFVVTAVFTLGVITWTTYMHTTGRDEQTEGVLGFWMIGIFITLFVWPVALLVGLGMGLGKYLAHHDKGREVK